MSPEYYAEWLSAGYRYGKSEIASGWRNGVSRYEILRNIVWGVPTSYASGYLLAFAEIDT